MGTVIAIAIRRVLSRFFPPISRFNLLSLQLQLYPMSNIRGRGRGRGGVTSIVPSTSSHSHSRDFDDDDFDEPSHQLRNKYSTQLATTKELFPDWSDEDILQAIQDANGDVETTILRISEGAWPGCCWLLAAGCSHFITAHLHHTGHAQQWGAVTKKKVKKDQPAFTPSHPNTNTTTARGGFAHRGGRGGFGQSGLL